MPTTTRVVEAHGLDALGARMRASRRVLVVTGTGLGAGSGLPTRHGVGGLYEDPALEALHHVAALPANLPSLWSLWGPLRAVFAEAEGLPGHAAAARAWEVRA